ncbi:MAG: TonB-dependent receptor, partial [Cyclobacteriaceae bacterium]|nr:TonB-dependent receptor [Cyclobacteriaceae bacterium]
MKTSFILFLTLFLLSFEAFSQNTQNIKGTVLDKNTQQPLIGAYVLLAGSTSTGAVTDIEGQYLIKDIPVGRIALQSQFIGYEPWQSGYLELTSAKELIINIELSPSITTMDTVIIRPPIDPGQAANDFTTVSGRSFSPEDAQRYAGSINDVGRMAVSIPGVQLSQSDNQNTMVIRANSPYGLSWRLEGVEIPNPNHFADIGSSGGGISALSIFVLGQSDFLSGAFAPQYGNAFSGIVDMNFRKGNTENREHRFQIGVIGIDFASEGPFSSKNNKSSYLFNYRYSTLGILGKMGVRVVKPNVSNTFQDLSFNMYFKLSPKTTLNVFSLGGLSNEFKDPDPTPTSWDDVRQYSFPTTLGVVGAKVRHLINKNSYLSFTLSGGFNSVAFENDTVDVNKAFRLDEEYYTDKRISSALTYSLELNNRTTLQMGSLLTHYNYNVEYNRFNFENKVMNTFNKGNNSTLLTEGFIQSQYRASQNLTLVGGLHAQVLSLNNTYSIEPRASIKYSSNNGITSSFSYGMHSRILSFNFYETTLSDPVTNALLSRPNINLEMMKAHHYVFMLQKSFQKNIRLKLEPYIQQLFDVPVS